MARLLLLSVPMCRGARSLDMDEVSKLIRMACFLSSCLKVEHDACEPLRTHCLCLATSQLCRGRMPRKFIRDFGLTDFPPPQKRWLDKMEVTKSENLVTASTGICSWNKGLMDRHKQQITRGWHAIWFIVSRCENYSARREYRREKLC